MRNGWDVSMSNTSLDGFCSKFPEDTMADLSGCPRLPRTGLKATSQTLGDQAQ